MKEMKNLITFHIPLLITVFAIMGPLAYLFFSSIISDADAILFGKNLQIPSTISFDPYIMAFKMVPLAKALFDTGFYSVGCALLVTLVTCISGYAFAFLKFRYKVIVLKSYIFAQLIPGYAFLIPMFIYATSYGFHDTYWVVIFTLGGGTIPFALWMAFSFLKLIPSELHDSAIIDGCSEFQAFVRIFLPLIIPGIVAIFVYSFVMSWGQFFWPLILTGSRVKSLPVTLTYLKECAEITGTVGLNYVMASGVIGLIPPVIVSIVFQRWLIKGLTAGAVKG